MSRINSLFCAAIAAAGIICPNLALSQGHAAHGAPSHNHASAPVDCVNLSMPPWNGLPEAARLQMATLQEDISALSTPEAAKAAGFNPVLGDIPGMGVHWVHPARMVDPVDINLPDTNGFDLCQKMRDKVAGFDAPVIFLSASRSADDVKKAMAMGGTDYMVKPFTPDAIMARLDKWLGDGA